jgi:hypothetical protein
VTADARTGVQNVNRGGGFASDDHLPTSIWRWSQICESSLANAILTSRKAFLNNAHHLGSAPPMNELTTNEVRTAPWLRSPRPHSATMMRSFLYELLHHAPGRIRSGQ